MDGEAFPQMNHAQLLDLISRVQHLNHLVNPSLGVLWLKDWVNSFQILFKQKEKKWKRPWNEAFQIVKVLMLTKLLVSGQGFLA